MAIEDVTMRLGPYGANSPFLETGAAVPCPRHPAIFIRIDDAEKERQAYVLADQRLDAADERQAAKASMTISLETMAARCPVCDAEKGLSDD
jgi:hypothetical protein